MGRTTINLAPADVKKEGPSFDLPIALGMLAASEQIETDQLDNFVIVGELALTGAVRPCKGFCRWPSGARTDGKVGVLVPAENAARPPWFRACRSFRCKTCAKPPVSSRARSKLPRPRWILPGCLISRGRRPGFCRSQRPGKRETRAGNFRGGRPQRTADRPARAPANPCWPSGCQAFCRRSPWMKRWKPRRFTASSVCWPRARRW